MYRRAHWETYAPLFGDAARRLDLDQVEAHWQAALSAQELVLVAIDADAIVGVAHAEADVLGSLYLLEGFTGRGLGRALLRQALAALAQQGHRTARIHVLATNAAAIGFYEACGARAVAREQVRGDEGVWENVVLQISTT